VCLDTADVVRDDPLPTRHMRLAATARAGSWPCSAVPGDTVSVGPEGQREYTPRTRMRASFHRDRVGVRTSPTPHIGVAASTGRRPEAAHATRRPSTLIPRCGPSRRPCGRIESSAEHPSALGLRPDVTTGVATQVEVVEMDDAEPRQLGGTARALEAAHRRAGLGNLFSSVAKGRFEARLGRCC
jgi:hypothetical protein